MRRAVIEIWRFRNPSFPANGARRDADRRSIISPVTGREQIHLPHFIKGMRIRDEITPQDRNIGENATVAETRDDENFYYDNLRRCNGISAS